MRAWIDRTNDGLSGMPADGISLPLKRGLRHVPLGQVRRLGYINTRLGGRGHDRLWPILLQKYFEHLVAKHRFKIRREGATMMQKNRRPDSIVTNFYFT
jgi:hypothetical protein